MRQQIEEALRRTGADYSEILIERAQSTEISFRGHDLDRISSSSSLGGTARAVVKGGWGIATFSDISALAGRVKEAVACARTTPCPASRSLAPSRNGPTRRIRRRSSSRR